MSAVDPYEYDEPRRHRSSRHGDRRDRRDDRDPRYVEVQETYVRAPAGAPLAPDPPYQASRATELIRRPDRQDSDMSIEEVRRDFPPPGAGAYAQQRSMVRDDRYGPPVRSRSAERGSYLDPREERRSRKSTVYEEKIVEPRRRSLSRNQKILAGVAGAALAVGGKEFFDRKKAHGRPVSRNPLQTAAIGAAGAFATYEAAELYTKHQNKGAEEKVKTYVAHRGRDGDVDEYYSSDEEPEEKPRKSRRKSIVEGALGLAGIGAAAKAAGGGRDKSRSRRGSPDSFTSRKSGRSRSRGGRGKSPEGAAKYQQAAKAALIAGATEAFRVRNEPGGWGGAKGKRILTAAIGAGGIDAAADRDPSKGSKRHILEAVVGGLAGNRLINGSRNNVEEEERSKRGASRSRSRAPSRGGGGGGGGGAGLAALATAGIGALAAKKISDRSRSRSRGGDRGDRRDRRRGSPDSYDSRSPSPRDRHKRSKSVSDYARKGLAALGIGEAAGGADDHDNRREVVEETRVHRSSRRRRSPDDDYDDRRGSTRDGGYGRDRGDRDRGDRDRGDRDRGDRDRGDPYGDSRYADSRTSVGGGSRSGGSRRQDARAKDGRKNKRIAEGKQSASSDSESSLGSSSGDEKQIKKMKAPRY